MGGTRKINDHNSDIPTVDRIIFQDRVLQGNENILGQTRAYLPRSMSGQKVSIRIMDHGIRNPHSDNLPERSYHKNKICNPKRFSHHGSFHFVDDTDLICMATTKRTHYKWYQKTFR